MHFLRDPGCTFLESPARVGVYYSLTRCHTTFLSGHEEIVTVENVSKKYFRNAQTHLNYGLRDLFRVFRQRQTNALDLRKDEFLAVDNVSFHLYPGDSFALIGRNGSGKTTLLKMMNGLIRPDAGAIMMSGQVQALINLGVGFNPNLSGRENIYSLAALMGLGRRETNQILDAVVDFSELEEFIESPVGTYSSGMKARLGFSVAVHLKPEILLIDEILSVGDYAFQNKCFVKMQELKKQGVAIVLVSHSHTQVIQVCESALWIHKGRMMKTGTAKETVHAYLSFLDEQERVSMEKAERLKSERAQQAPPPARSSESIYGPIYDEFDRVEALHCELMVDGQTTTSLRVHDELTIKCSFRLKAPVSDLNVSLSFFRNDGLKLNTISTLNGDLLKNVHSGEVTCRVRIPDFNLNPGRYVLVMPIHEGKSYLYRNVVKEFVVTGNGRFTWEVIDFKYRYEVETNDGKMDYSEFL